MTQKNAYKKRLNRYDDVLTGRKWWSRFYMNTIWKVDDNKVAGEVLDMIPDNFSGKLLDVPFGTGVFTENKYKQLNKAEITGLDYSEEMLSLAYSRLKEQKLENINLLQGDVCTLPYPDKCFDIVLSMNGFHAFSDKEHAFEKTHRVLKPGGMFCGCFYIKGERKIADWLVRNILNKKGLFVPPHYTYKDTEEKLNTLYSKVELKNHRSIVLFKCIK